MIVDDNQKCGTRPTLKIPRRSSSRDSKDRVRQITSTSPRPLSMPPTPVSGTDTSDELFIPHPPPYSSSPQKYPPTPGSRPAVQPKPQTLQGRPSTINGAVNGMPIDTLAERFTQLRVPRKEVLARSHPDDRVIQNGGSVEMPSPADYAKPAGPRSMPPPPNHPPPPPKVPLNVPTEAALPRAPSPAYDPSKTIVSPKNATNRKAQIIGPSIQQSIPNGTADREGAHDRPQAVRYSYDLPGSSNSSRPSSAEYSHPSSINADRLFDMLREYNVLVIDVRTREEFDYGHIYAKSIMCIEPVSLRSGLSAEELEETLVVSPPAELEFFERRNEFDYVVYYDQHTSSESFLAGPPNRSTPFAMRALHDTMHEFNYYRPLRRPPLMLKGGLDAG